VSQGPETVEAVCSRLRACLAAWPQVEFAVLFGSAARGELRADSDVDLAVRFRPGVISGWEVGGLVDAVGRASGRPADIVDLERARSLVLRREIGAGVLVMGDPAELVELRRRSFREWRDVGPRFRRCAHAQLRAQLGLTPARSKP
jgi:predicted nucleotidyltransferase